VLERLQIEAFYWDNVPVITILVLYCILQFMFFSLVPVILFESGATALQLALLTSDSFNILAGMLNHEYKVEHRFATTVTRCSSAIDRCPHSRSLFCIKFIQSRISSKMLFVCPRLSKIILPLSLAKALLD